MLPVLFITESIITQCCMWHCTMGTELGSDFELTLLFFAEFWRKWTVILKEWPLMWRPRRGLLSQFVPLINYLCFLSTQNYDGLLKILFIFGRCHCSWTLVINDEWRLVLHKLISLKLPMALDKDQNKCESMGFTDTFAKAEMSPTEKLPLLVLTPKWLLVSQCHQ